jgi:hypothetical protein
MASVAYIGPGDIAASATAWWGLRAYSAAKAGTNCCDIIRASDSTTNTFTTLASGLLDTASIATFLNATTGKISKLYDQTGGGHDMVQTTDANRPAYIASGIGSNSIARFSGNQLLQVTLAGNPANPSTVVGVCKRVSSASQECLFGGDNAGYQIGYANAGANTAFLYQGSVVSGTCADAAYHSILALMNGASSNLYSDGSSIASGNAGAAGNVNTIYFIGSSTGGANFLNGDVTEVGIWSSDISANAASLSSNAKTFYGY